MSRKDIALGEDEEPNQPQPGTVFHVNTDAKKPESEVDEDIEQDDLSELSKIDEVKNPDKEDNKNAPEKKTEEPEPIKLTSDEDAVDEEPDTEDESKSESEESLEAKDETSSNDEPELDEVDPKNWPEEDEAGVTASEDLKDDDTEDEPDDNKTKAAHANLGATATSASNKPKPKTKKFKIVIVCLLFFLLICSLAAFGYYYFVAQPKMVVADYAGKFLDQQSAPQSLDYDFSTKFKDKNSQLYSLSAKGKLDTLKDNLEANSIELNGQFGSAGESSKPVKVDAEVIFINEEKVGKTFLNIHEPKFVDELIPGILNKWVELPTTEAAALAAGEDISCDEDRQTQLTQYIKGRLADVKIKDTKRVGLLSKKIAGKNVNQFQGKIAGSELASLAQDIHTEADRLCNTNQYDENTYNELKKISLSYNIWKGKDLDRVSLIVTSQNQFDATLQLTTTGYNTPKDIREPENAKPLEDLTKGLEEPLNDKIETTGL